MRNSMTGLMLLVSQEISKYKRRVSPEYLPYFELIGEILKSGIKDKDISYIDSDLCRQHCLWVELDYEVYKKAAKEYWSQGMKRFKHKRK